MYFNLFVCAAMLACDEFIVFILDVCTSLNNNQV